MDEQYINPLLIKEALAFAAQKIVATRAAEPTAEDLFRQQEQALTGFKSSLERMKGPWEQARITSDELRRAFKNAYRYSVLKQQRTNPNEQSDGMNQESGFRLLTEGFEQKGIRFNLSELAKEIVAEWPVIK